MLMHVHIQDADGFLIFQKIWSVILYSTSLILIGCGVLLKDVAIKEVMVLSVDLIFSSGMLRGFIGELISSQLQLTRRSHSLNEV